mmetsp:Transcript_5335/g.7933  ORF Transcript_5335/g.7933 Transcript_5335/m.7933 type:complete len:92 (+) Transcript_5335:7-282(+)
MKSRRIPSWVEYTEHGGSWFQLEVSLDKPESNQLARIVEHLGSWIALGNLASKGHLVKFIKDYPSRFETSSPRPLVSQENHRGCLCEGGQP